MQILSHLGLRPHVSLCHEKGVNVNAQLCKVSHCCVCHVTAGRDDTSFV